MNFGKRESRLGEKRKNLDAFSRDFMNFGKWFDIDHIKNKFY